jgi:uncharacterized protein
MSFANYKQLLQKVDTIFNEVSAKHGDKMRCARKCHSCCQPNLSVSALERDYIRQEAGQLKDSLLAQEQKNPHKSKRCAFLDQEGACTIYEWRPIICRSHGIPIQYKDAREDIFRDVCELNFTSADIAELAPSEVLNIDTLNMLLALLNTQAYGKKSKRYPLLPSKILE